MAPIITTSVRRRGNERPSKAVYILAPALVLALALTLILKTKTKTSPSPSPAGSPSMVAGEAVVTSPHSTKGENPPPRRDDSRSQRGLAANTAGNVDAKGNVEDSVGTEMNDGSQGTATSEKRDSWEPPSPILVERTIFDNRVENLLESISMPGAKFGLMPTSINMTDEQVLEFLKKPVEIFEDDDEATIAAKERTAAMKTAALKYIEDGGTFDQFVRENVIAANEVQGVMDDVRKEMKRRLHDEGVEAAQAYLAEVNPQLREQGFEEVKLRKGEIILMERQKTREAAEAARKE